MLVKTIRLLYRSLEKLYHWSNEWQLTISYQKCSIMSIGRSNSTHCFNISSNRVQPVCISKDLGVNVCSDLSFATYVNTIAAKAHARACLIHKCFISRDAVTLTRAFVTYVRPILEYALVIWSPYHVNQISKLELVQRRLTQRIAGLRDMPYVERLKKLQLERLETRKLRNDLLFTYKVLFGLASVD